MKKIHYLLLLVLLATGCCKTEVERITVIPCPNEVDIKSGTFKASGAEISFDAQFEQFAKDAIISFGKQLSGTSGADSNISEGCSRSGFIFRYDGSIPKEAYRINVDRKSAVVEASSLNGVIYAIQTIKQMLPSEIFGNTNKPEADWTLPCCTINDAPRFGYRGAHLDVGRHFYNVEEVKRYLDILELHKINTFHWHLTEDQGWRVEIKKYPKLTEVGAVRKETLVGILGISNVYDNTPYGEGLWYSQDELREIVDYAARKGITVIPEIDLPGHMLGALAAYPELGCTGGPYEVWTKWGVSEDVLCAGKESTMLFIEDVLSELCEIFPGEYFHIGGDECPKVRWETCPHCQAKIKELGIKGNDKHSPEQFLQSYVTARIEKFLASKGKKIIGWDEILEGELSPNATVMSWRGTEGGIQAARLGHDAIMTPYTYCYLDYLQAEDTANEPYTCVGAYLPVEKCYSYEPHDEDMSDEEKSHILGVQANLWTEYIRSEDHLHYQLLPRLSAISEVQWCQPEIKNWERFCESAVELCSIFDVLGYNYAPHIFDISEQISINHETNNVEVTLYSFGNTPIRYTLDGSTPDSQSELYTGPLSIDKSCTLTAYAQRSGAETRVITLHFIENKALGRPAKGIGETLENYTFNYPDNLLDGIRGKNDYGTGEWVGMYGNPFEIIIEMDGNTPFSSVTLGTFIERADDVFGPTSINISVSDDGENYNEIAETTCQTAGPAGPERCAADYTVTFPETTSRYMKVTADPLASIPDWHKSHGKPAYLFVDEVIVK